MFENELQIQKLQFETFKKRKDEEIRQINVFNEAEKEEIG